MMTKVKMATTLLATSTIIALSSILPANAISVSGVYANLWGREYYLGDFSNQPSLKSQCPSHCQWIVTSNYRMIAHGGYSTIGGAWSLIRNWR